jgi:hypothetical protein
VGGGREARERQRVHGATLPVFAYNRRVSPRLCVVVLALCAGGCGDDPPLISNLTYSPNAGFVGSATNINVGFDYSDEDNDISQSVVQIVDPSGMMTTGPMTPIPNTFAGVTGQVSVSLQFTPTATGIWSFSVWIIDLKGRESNHLGGIVRIAAM